VPTDPIVPPNPILPTDPVRMTLTGLAGSAQACAYPGGTPAPTDACQSSVPPVIPIGASGAFAAPGSQINASGPIMFAGAGFIALGALLTARKRRRVR
jgi:hypothetical protein